MNETKLWFCDIFGKTINIKSISKYVSSKTHKRKQKYGTFVKEYEFFNPDIIKDCRKNNSFI